MVKIAPSQLKADTVFQNPVMLVDENKRAKRHANTIVKMMSLEKDSSPFIKRLTSYVNQSNQSNTNVTIQKLASTPTAKTRQSGLIHN